MVSSLMDDSGNWDIDLILDVFDNRDANLILSIPLDTGVQDSWYWRQEKLGCYSVKSAYSLLQDLKSTQQTEPNSGFWRKLWNLKIPPKVKNFLWRASTNCLPTKDLLRSKRVQVINLCPTCNELPETILHILVSCSYAVTCLERVHNQPIIGEFSSFQEWLQLVFDQQETDNIYITALVCWMIWKNRNELVWNQHSLEITEVVESAYSVLNQWKSVQDNTFDRFMAYMSQDDGDEHWHTPPINSIKINVDAAIFAETSCYSHAFVVRDHEGRLVEARSKCMRGQPNPELAEAYGIREVLSWVKENGCTNTIIESDCLQLVQTIRSSLSCLSYLGRVIEDCRDMLASLRHKNVCFKFVKRSANRVPHYLARYSCSIADRRWRMGDVHSDFHHVLLNDLHH